MKPRFIIALFLVVGIYAAPAQDPDEEALPSEAHMISGYTPVAAPLILEENVPELNKEEIVLRLKKIQKEIPLTYNHTINSFIHYFTVRNREYTRMMLRRKDYYFPIFERILRENNMPDELKYLAIVESGLNPRAKSRAGAVGLWQFIESTGRHYKLNSDAYIDERSDPEKSTRAACEYLKYLYTMFGNWELALAAYNCGPGNVRKAKKAARNKDDFWEIYYHLPRETRSYVPQFVAVAYTMNFFKEHNLEPDFQEDFSNVVVIHTDQYVNLDVLAASLDMCTDELLRYNPTLKKNVVPDYLVNFQFRIPASKYGILASNYCSIMDSCATKGLEESLQDINPYSEKAKERHQLTHVVKKGEILESIAKKYKVSMKELVAWNNLSGKNLKFGQKLTIWRPDVQNNSDKLNKELAKIDFKKPKGKIYLVQPGDTLWSISQKTAVPMSKLKKINRLKGNELKPGQKLTLT